MYCKLCQLSRGCKIQRVGFVINYEILLNTSYFDTIKNKNVREMWHYDREELERVFIMHGWSNKNYKN
jgi:hypothetical protein